MQDPEKKSPYAETPFLVIIMLVIPFATSLLIYIILKKMNETTPQIAIQYQSIVFGFGLAFVTDISLFAFGVFDRPIKAVARRIENFFYHCSISHRLARKWYLEDVKEFGLALWIYVLEILFTLGVTITALIKVLEIYLGK